MNEPDPEILRALKVVIDPELGLDIVSLGLVYGAVREGDTARITLTMTTPACPLGEVIVADARAAVEAMGGVRHADIELVFEPLWTSARMSQEARELLGDFE